MFACLSLPLNRTARDWQILSGCRNGAGFADHQKVLGPSAPLFELSRELGFPIIIDTFDRFHRLLVEGIHSHLVLAFEQQTAALIHSNITL